MGKVVFFINKEGNKITSDEVCSHVELANIIIENDIRLKEEYNSGNNSIKSTANFLQECKGFIRGEQSGKDGNIIYDSSRLTERQKKALNFFIEKGYSSIDIYAPRSKEQQGYNGDER